MEVSGATLAPPKMFFLIRTAITPTIATAATEHIAIAAIAPPDKPLEDL